MRFRLEKSDVLKHLPYSFNFELPGLFPVYVEILKTDIGVAVALYLCSVL